MGFLSNTLKSLSGGAIEKKFDEAEQTQDEKELAGYVKSKIDEVKGDATRVSNEGIWLTNIAYLTGYDSIYYDTKQRGFRPVNASAGASGLKRGRIHANLILPNIQNRLARLCKNPPKFDVRPDSMTQEDKDKARANLEILKAIWDQNGVELNEKRIDLMQWAQQCGHAYVRTSWDETLGEDLYDPITGEPIGKKSGDIRCDIHSGFEVFADPLAKNDREWSWAAVVKVRKLDYFAMHYGEKGKAVKAEEAWLLSVQYENKINGLNTRGDTNNGPTMMKNAAIEISYYERKCEKYPKGRHIVVANGVLLQDKELLIGEIPLVKFDDIKVAGKFYSEAVITHLRPLQDQFNRNLRVRADWLNRMLRGKFLAAKGHGLMEEALNDDGTEVVEYDPVPNAAEPHVMQMPTIPQYAYTDNDDIKQQFAEICGIGEVSKGQLPSASIPAIGMQLLAEQDETRIGVQTLANENSWARVGRQMLLMAKEQYTIPRKRKQAGKNGEYIVDEYSSEDILSNPDVVVIPNSTVPTSKALRRQELMNLYTQGLLGDPMDPSVREKLLNWLEYGDIGEVWLDRSIDMQQIKKSIKMLEEGQVPTVSEFDNHPLHIQEKNRYRKSEKFDLLDPMSQQNFMNDMNTHLDFIVEQTTPPEAIREPSAEEAVMAQNAEAEQMENEINMQDANAAIEQVPEA